MTPGVVQGSEAVAAPPPSQDQMMITTPAGPMHLPVPAGVSEGATFVVPVPRVVEATVV